MDDLWRHHPNLIFLAVRNSFRTMPSLNMVVSTAARASLCCICVTMVTYHSKTKSINHEKWMTQLHFQSVWNERRTVQHYFVPRTQLLLFVKEWEVSCIGTGHRFMNHYVTTGYRFGFHLLMTDAGYRCWLQLLVTDVWWKKAPLRQRIVGSKVIEPLCHWLSDSLQEELIEAPTVVSIKLVGCCGEMK